MGRNPRRSARKLPRDGDKVVGVEVLGVHPSALGEERMIGRTADGHSVRKLQLAQLSAPTWPDTPRLEGTVLGEHQVAVADLGDRLVAGGGPLDQRACPPT